MVQSLLAHKFLKGHLTFKMADLCLAYIQSQEIDQDHQVCNFANEYIDKTTTDSRDHRTRDKVYKEILEINSFSEETAELIRKTKSLIDYIDGGLRFTLTTVSVGDVVKDLDFGLDELSVLIKVLMNGDIVSLYNRFPTKTKKAKKITNFKDLLFSYFITIN